jgi:hypothetical protein
MSTPNITLNPALASSVTGSFGVAWDGLIAGMGPTSNDPVARFYLNGGFLASTETLPMWGGLGISEAVPTPQASPPLSPDPALGGPIVRATNVLGGNTTANLTGFSVFDQNYSAVNSPQSEVPMTSTYGAVAFYRLGSGARIAVAADSALSGYGGSVISRQVSWDYVNQKLVPYQAAFGANTITAASWSAGVVSFTTNTNHGISPGGIFTISGVSPAGYNGTYVAITAATTALTAALVTDPGAYVSGGALAAGGGALPCQLLKLSFGNSMVPTYNSTTNFLNWNRSGNAALILI